MSGDLLLAEVEAAVLEAHSRVAVLLDRRLPRNVTALLVRAAMSLRHALALLESERRGVVPVPASVSDPEAFTRFVVRDGGLPVRLRKLAEGALRAPAGVVTPERRLCEIAEHVASLRALLNCDLVEAARRTAQAQEWAAIPVERIAHAVRVHGEALAALERRP